MAYPFLSAICPPTGCQLSNGYRPSVCCPSAVRLPSVYHLSAVSLPSICCPSAVHPPYVHCLSAVCPLSVLILSAVFPPPVYYLSSICPPSIQPSLCPSYYKLCHLYIKLCHTGLLCTGISNRSFQADGPPVTSITLPDIFSSISSKTIILKLDIQGYECKVRPYLI